MVWVVRAARSHRACGNVTDTRTGRHISSRCLRSLLPVQDQTLGGRLGLFKDARLTQGQGARCRVAGTRVSHGCVSLSGRLAVLCCTAADAAPGASSGRECGEVGTGCLRGRPLDVYALGEGVPYSHHSRGRSGVFHAARLTSVQYRFLGGGSVARRGLRGRPLALGANHWEIGSSGLRGMPLAARPSLLCLEVLRMHPLGSSIWNPFGQA